MARTNQQIIINDPSVFGFNDLNNQTYNVVSYGTAIEGDPNYKTANDGYYEIYYRFTTDSTEQAQTIPATTLTTKSSNPTALFSASNLSLSASYSISWSISRPDLVDLFVLTGNRVAVRAKAPHLLNVPMGTLTASGTIDGIPFSKTVNLKTGFDTVTGLGDITITRYFNNSDPNVIILNFSYSTNGGSSWVNVTSSNAFTVPNNSTVKFKATVRNSTGFSAYIQLVAPNETQSDTTTWTTVLETSGFASSQDYSVDVNVSILN